MKFLSLAMIIFSLLLFPLKVGAQQADINDEPALLTVSKDDGQTTVLPEQQLIYEIVVTNNDVELELSNINLVDNLPDNVSFVSAEDGGVNNSGDVSWPVFSLAPQSSFQTTVTVSVSASAGGSDLVENNVTASIEELELFAEDSDVDTVLVKGAEQTFSNPEVQPTVSTGVLGESTDVLAETGNKNSSLSTIAGISVVFFSLFLIRFSREASTEVA